MRNATLIICTVINISLTIIALIVALKVDVSWTASLGDTFGGLLSPIIGGVSIYFIYKTFNAQSMQLSDQLRATNFSASSLYFTEVSRMIADVKDGYDHLKYGEFIDEVSGMNTTEYIKKDLSESTLPDRFSQSGPQLIRSLNDQLARIALIANVGREIQDHYLKKLYQDKFKSELKELLVETLPVFEAVKRSLKLMLKDSDYEKDNKNNFSWMAWQYELFSKSMNDLHMVGDIINKKEDTDKRYKVRINKITTAERLSKIDLNEGWSVK